MKLLCLSLTLLSAVVTCQAFPVMSITSQVKLLSEATGNFFQISSSGDVAADSTDDSSTSDATLIMSRSYEQFSFDITAVFTSVNHNLTLGVNTSSAAADSSGYPLHGTIVVDSLTQFTLQLSQEVWYPPSFVLLLKTPDVHCVVKRTTGDRYSCQPYDEDKGAEDSRETRLTTIQGDKK